MCNTGTICPGEFRNLAKRIERNGFNQQRVGFINAIELKEALRQTILRTLIRG